MTMPLAGLSTAGAPSKGSMPAARAPGPLRGRERRAGVILMLSGAGRYRMGAQVVALLPAGPPPAHQQLQFTTSCAAIRVQA